MKTNATKCTFALYVVDAYILFFEEGDVYTGIWLHNRISEEERHVGTCFGGFPPYGRRVVGSSLVLADGRIKIYDIFRPEVHDLGKGSSAFFSSDGSKIVGSDAKTIFILNSDGTGAHTIFTEADPEKSIINPQISPDNKLVAFLENRISR